MTTTFSQLGKMGRLGNCLFQIATTISAAIKNNDTYAFPQWEYEPYFNLHECFNKNIIVNKIYREQGFHYSPIPNDKNLDLVGYFQTEKYFENNKQEIINFLTPIHHFEKEPGLCSIHVRRSDYVHFQDCHPLITMNYYNKAIEKSGYKKFLIFSDDINWCKKNFIGNMYDYAENNTPTVDLALMSKKCESNIICNSSFSWWGAYLNQSPNKIVIAPNIWFGPKLNYNNIKDLLPKEWIKI